MPRRLAACLPNPCHARHSDARGRQAIRDCAFSIDRRAGGIGAADRYSIFGRGFFQVVDYQELIGLLAGLQFKAELLD